MDLAEVATALERLESRVAESDRRRLVAEVAAEKGLSAPQTRRLEGSTREELLADADELLELFPGKGSGGRQDRRGADGRFRSGAVTDGEDDDDDFDPEKVADEVRGGDLEASEVADAIWNGRL